MWIFWQSDIWHLVPRQVCLQILPILGLATETGAELPVSVTEVAAALALMIALSLSFYFYF